MNAHYSETKGHVNKCSLTIEKLWGVAEPSEVETF